MLQSKDERSLFLKRNADARIISYPKSGRTWLSFLATWYIASYLGLPPPARSGKRLTTLLPEQDPDYIDGVAGLRREDRWAPILRFVHPATFTIADDEETHIDRSTAPHQVVLLRDPRDVVVSHFHHVLGFAKGKLRDKSGRTLRLPPDTSIEEFVRSPNLGIRKVVAFIEAAHRWALANRANLVFYEDLAADTGGTLAAFLRACGMKDIDPALAGRAVEACAFDRMQRAEAASSRTRAGGRRVRKGAVGGHRDELPERELAFANEVIAASRSPILDRYR